MIKHIAKAISPYVARADGDLDTGKYRNDFMRDRDRILYSKPFRRLSRKTQIFLPASDDHVRTRLTHSLEVSQISTISAGALGLDRDLTEAIALGHDMGHTPFGHTGERILNLIAVNCDLLGGLAATLQTGQMGFKHNLQGIRVAAELTDLYEGLPGLNLSNYTLWGIQNHTSKHWKKCGYRLKDDDQYTCNYPQNIKTQECIHKNNHEALENRFYDKYDNLLRIKTKDGYGHYAWSLEGLLVGVSDEIAQRHHDIEDGLIADVIQIKDIHDLIEQLIAPYFNKEEKKVFSDLSNSNVQFVIPKLSKLVIGCLNRSLIDNSRSNLKSFFSHFAIKKRDDFKELYPSLKLKDKFKTENGSISIQEIISYPPIIEKDEKIFKKELKNRILNSYQVQRMDGKARFVIRQLSKAYLSNPQQLPNNAIENLFLNFFPDKEGLGFLSINDKRAWLNEMYFSSNDLKIREHLIRTICDLISGMTDDFALAEHARLYSTSENMDLRHY